MGMRADETEYDEMSAIFEPEEDPLPENCFYRDEGCDLAESCLNCPFEECVYERYENTRTIKKAERTREIAQLYKVKNKEVREIAEQYGLSERSVYRELQKVLGKRKKEGNGKHKRV